MPSEKIIKVTIDNQGNPDVEVKGYADGKCLKETALLEADLGKVVNRTKKAEAYKDSPAGVKIGSGS